MPAKTSGAKATAVLPQRVKLAPGDKVIVAGAGRDWTGTVSTRRLPDGGQSVHPQHDDTTIFVTFDETGISMPVALRQVSRLRSRRA
jgi:hypothetical protein